MRTITIARIAVSTLALATTAALASIWIPEPLDMAAVLLAAIAGAVSLTFFAGTRPPA